MSENKGSFQHTILNVSYYFSYWVVLWFVLYYIALWIPSSKNMGWLENFKTYANPALALWFALLYNIFSLIVLFTYSAPSIILIKYIVMTLTVKVLPLYLLRDRKILLWNDLIVSLGLYLVYLFYMFFVAKVDPLRTYTVGFDLITKGKHETPFFSLIYYLFKV